VEKDKSLTRTPGSGGQPPQPDRGDRGETTLVVTPRSATESTAFANGGQFSMAHRRENQSLPSLPFKSSK